MREITSSTASYFCFLSSPCSSSSFFLSFVVFFFFEFVRRVTFLKLLKKNETQSCLYLAVDLQQTPPPPKQSPPCVWISEPFKWSTCLAPPSPSLPQHHACWSWSHAPPRCCSSSSSSTWSAAVMKRRAQTDFTVSPLKNKQCQCLCGRRFTTFMPSVLSCCRHIPLDVCMIAENIPVNMNLRLFIRLRVLCWCPWFNKHVLHWETWRQPCVLFSANVSQPTAQPRQERWKKPTIPAPE